MALTGVAVYHCSCTYCDFETIVEHTDEAIAIFDEHPDEYGENHFVEVTFLEQNQSN